MHLLFDFDGTLADSFQCVMQKTILLADEFNFRKITAEEVDGLRDLSSREVIRFLKIPVYKIPLIIHAMRKHLHAEILRIPPVSGIPQVLNTLHQRQFQLGILTSNSADNVSRWLAHHALRDLFDFIHVESQYFSKKYLIKKTLKKYQIPCEKTFYICDETRDIDAAENNQVKSVAVTWGYNSEKTLLTHTPTLIARQPEDILKLLNLSTV